MTTFKIYSGTPGRYHGEREAASFCVACYELAADDHEFRRLFNPRLMTWNGDLLFAKGGV